MTVSIASIQAFYVAAIDYPMKSRGPGLDELAVSALSGLSVKL